MLSGQSWTGQGLHGIVPERIHSRADFAHYKDYPQLESDKYKLLDSDRTLRSWGHELIDPANPLFILGTSIERLRSQKEQNRTIYDWFQEEAVRIMRPDGEDGE